MDPGRAMPLPGKNTNFHVEQSIHKKDIYYICMNYGPTRYALVHIRRGKIIVNQYLLRRVDKNRGNTYSAIRLQLNSYLVLFNFTPEDTVLSEKELFYIVSPRN